ncbi:hypothetical protein Q8F55_008321 [Vanrija albida]|uniref:Uncharacterized protein n=1 Tax=Vanrija albida TaxID=181172 RepID=A0ABR3PW10_9TREE
MWPRYAEFDVAVVHRARDAPGKWERHPSGLVHGGNVGGAVIRHAAHVRRAFDSEYARTSASFRLDVLRQYMYVKYRRSRVHAGPGAEAKLAPLQATYPEYADTFNALRDEMGLGARMSWESAVATGSDEDSAEEGASKAVATLEGTDPQCSGRRSSLAHRLATFASARRELDDWLDEVAVSAKGEGARV